MSNKRRIKVKGRFQVQMQMEDGEWADLEQGLLGDKQEALERAYTCKLVYGGEWRVQPRVLTGGRA